MKTNGQSLTLVLGGARSGKSRFAEALVTDSGLAPVYVATGRALDDEMTFRISQHKARRGLAWTTVEEPVDLVGALQRHARADRAILVDCLTLWLTNLMMDERVIETEIEALTSSLEALPGKVIAVSNEVGLGIVPENKMARAFRDHAGILHQKIGSIADHVYFLAAGLPLKMKG